MSDPKVKFTNTIEALEHLDGYLRGTFKQYNHDYHEWIQAAIKHLRGRKN